MVVDAIDSKSAASEFLSGMRASVPVLVAVLPFGLLFGAIAAGNGFSVFEAMLMSGTVYGGASQMVGIELFGQKVAPWLIVLSIFAVNFRHVLYSASIGRRIAHWPVIQQALGYFVLTDPQFAVAERKAEAGETVGRREGPEQQPERQHRDDDRHAGPRALHEVAPTRAAFDRIHCCEFLGNRPLLKWGGSVT